MSSPSWQDRRFMFPVGREVHQGSRRYSGSKGSADLSTSTGSDGATAATAGVLDSPPATTAATATTASTGKVFPPWEGDRRFMGTVPREIHEGARRNSQSSDKSTGSTSSGVGAVKTSASPPTSPGGGIAAAIAGRRRSSASNGGAFSGLMGHRNSKDDYDQRRQGWEDMKAPGGFGGLFGGFVNKSGDKK
ncbi:hypothetical protein PV08_03148 [Exophiala spinifera]|uniref:Uncharacterized protein n=1 Tax=Exophiala spinifera TaxID=91928 RepID=A0A0D2C5K2_9EURO|nr:uncharacterized protein PV08_03148 [Exophiala spinifera]KIW18859.1 hypothetical protein PV08_03148 [Exophiala spinifera]